MQTFETSLHYRLVHMGDFDPLTKPKLFVDYMLGAFATAPARKACGSSA
jgi:hypothetical protein